MTHDKRNIPIDKIKLKGGTDFPHLHIDKFTNIGSLRQRIVNVHDSIDKFEHPEDLRVCIDALRTLMLLVALYEGKELPPIILRDGMLYDGTHRVFAYQMKGEKNIDVIWTTSKQGEEW